MVHPALLLLLCRERLRCGSTLNVLCQSVDKSLANSDDAAHRDRQVVQAVIHKPGLGPEMPNQPILGVSKALEVLLKINREAGRLAAEDCLKEPASAVPAEPQQIDEGVDREGVVANEPVDRDAFIFDVDLQVAGFNARHLAQLLDRHLEQRAVQRVCVEVVDHQLGLYMVLEH